MTNLALTVLLVGAWWAALGLTEVPTARALVLASLAVLAQLLVGIVADALTVLLARSLGATSGLAPFVAALALVDTLLVVARSDQLLVVVVALNQSSAGGSESEQERGQTHHTLSVLLI